MRVAPFSLGLQNLHFNVDVPESHSGLGPRLKVNPFVRIVAAHRTRMLEVHIESIRIRDCGNHGAIRPFYASLIIWFCSCALSNGSNPLKLFLDRLTIFCKDIDCYK